MSDFPLISFKEHLREERKRAGLTQEELAQKVEASDLRMSASYVTKMETGLLPPPSRKAAVGLADALGMSNRPVTLYVLTEDIAALRRFAFFLEANVAGAKDVQEIILCEFEDDDAEQGEQQAISTPITSLVHPVEDDDFTFASPLKTSPRRSDETAQLRQMLAQVDTLRATIKALIAEKEERDGRTERP